MHGYHQHVYLLPEGRDRGTEAHQILVRRSINRYLRRWCPGREGCGHHIETQKEVLQQRIQTGVQAITDPETVAAEEIQTCVLS